MRRFKPDSEVLLINALLQQGGRSASGCEPLHPDNLHYVGHLINTAASARWENPRTKQQLFQQFIIRNQ